MPGFILSQLLSGVDFCWAWRKLRGSTVYVCCKGDLVQGVVWQHCFLSHSSGFKYMLNNKERRMEPCGSSLMSTLGKEEPLLIMIFWILIERKALIYFHCCRFLEAGYVVISSIKYCREVHQHEYGCAFLVYEQVESSTRMLPPYHARAWCLTERSTGYWQIAGDTGDCISLASWLPCLEKGS